MESQSMPATSLAGSLASLCATEQGKALLQALSRCTDQEGACTSALYTASKEYQLLRMRRNFLRQQLLKDILCEWNHESDSPADTRGVIMGKASDKWASRRGRLWAEHDLRKMANLPVDGLPVHLLGLRNPRAVETVSKRDHAATDTPTKGVRFFMPRLRSMAQEVVQLCSPFACEKPSIPSTHTHETLSGLAKHFASLKRDTILRFQDAAALRIRGFDVRRKTRRIARATLLKLCRVVRNRRLESAASRYDSQLAWICSFFEAMTMKLKLHILQVTNRTYSATNVSELLKIREILLRNLAVRKEELARAKFRFTEYRAGGSQLKEVVDKYAETVQAIATLKGYVDMMQHA